jgi:hypothetical protein|tara:strand:- start:984 stop:1175 length:192 start_codon:yes stop_codon:yes gene_type:complete
LDDCLIQVWHIYSIIAQGVESITLQDIAAYCDLYRDELDPWQIDAIMGLDHERRKQWQTQSQD